MKEIGELLRNARESKGINIQEAQEATKIRSKYLLAIEDGDFGVLPPGEVYLRGFIRTYAEYLGLDPSEVIERYDVIKAREEAEARRKSEEKTEKPRPKPVIKFGVNLVRVWKPLLGFVAAIVGISVVATIYLGHRSSVEKDISVNGGAGTVVEEEAKGSSSTSTLASTPIEGKEPTTAGTAEPPASGSVAASHSIAIEVTERSWIRIMADGKVSVERIFNPGETATFPYEKELVIRVGNAAGVILTVDGNSIGVLGDPGQVVERRFPANFSGIGPE